jgi:GT2 family glycosyltransferase/ADP-heptose:LPS heptosyltransferase
MEDAKLDLTIIIPTFNRNQSVAECVLALDHYKHSEIIVVDDGSTQPVSVPNNARVIRHDRNKGRAAALNTGLKAAKNDLVLLIDDDIFAAPDMVSRLVDEFVMARNPKLALAGRVVWDPDVPLTLTMRWLEEVGPFCDLSSDRSAPLGKLSTINTMMWRPFVMEHGGFDENFTQHGLEDVELGLRLKHHGLQVRLVATALGFHHKSMRVRDLVERELNEGRSAVYLHSKFPASVPQAEDAQTLARNELQSAAAEAAVQELALLEQSDRKDLPEAAAELFLAIYRHNFLMGIQQGLREIGSLNTPASNRSTWAIYNEASHLESISEFDEARRLFQLVLHRGDEEYQAGAEYHLGCIEAELGNPEAAHSHLTECVRLNPGHRKARQLLHKQSPFEEIRPNVFERTDGSTASKILFVLFGSMGDVVKAFPVVAALREKYRSSEIVWLTLPEYAGLAQASLADSVHEAGPRGVIPWDWIESEGFTHVFYPEGNANQEDWQQSGLHVIDFMAQKCGVELRQRRAQLDPGPEALFEAEEFIRKHGLDRKAFLTASHVGLSSRYWPHSNLMKVAQEAGVPTVVFGAASDPHVPGTISCFGQSFRVVAALIRWSTFYIGPDSGVSWIASTTDTPMGVFMDPQQKRRFNIGFREVLKGEKNDIEEWDIHTSPDVVISCILNKDRACQESAL